MGEYRVSNTAKEDLIRIHRYGLQTFGRRQADRSICQDKRFLKRPVRVPENIHASGEVGGIYLPAVEVEDVGERSVR